VITLPRNPQAEVEVPSSGGQPVWIKATWRGDVALAKPDHFKTLTDVAIS